MNLPLYKLPMWFKIWWAKMFRRMFRGFGPTFDNDIILFNELNLWIETNGRPTTSNPNYWMNKKTLFFSLVASLFLLGGCEKKESVRVKTIQDAIRRLKEDSTIKYIEVEADINDWKTRIKL